MSLMNTRDCWLQIYFCLFSNYFIWLSFILVAVPQASFQPELHMTVELNLLPPTLLLGHDEIIIIRAKYSFHLQEPGTAHIKLSTLIRWKCKNTNKKNFLVKCMINNISCYIIFHTMYKWIYTLDHNNNHVISMSSLSSHIFDNEIIL